MADQLHLRVYTPERQVLDADVQEVTAPATLGEIGIFPEHAALVTSLDEGLLSWVTGARRTTVRITGGFAEVRDNLVTVLADGAEPVSG